MDWIRGHTLGRGSTATVSIAKSCRSGHVFAVKSAVLHHSESLKREQQIHSTLNCPQIVAYRGCDVTLENGALFYNVFMEYAPHGTLSHEARRHKGGIRETLVRRYTRQILYGLNYLHSRGIVHCDVKGQNVLVTEQGAKIADFGCARRVTVSGGGPIAGTPAFMAPEVARGEQQGFPADVWALGCTVLEMMTGEAPWRGVNDPVTALYRIGFSGEVLEIPSYVSEEGKDFLEKCFKRDPSERWTVEQLLGHGFVSNSVLLGGCDSDTPTSVLDRGFWELVETEKKEQRARHDCCCSWNSASPGDRIRGLCREDTMILFDAGPNWERDHGWITVRSNELPEDSEETEYCGTLCTFSEDNSLVAFYDPNSNVNVISMGLGSRSANVINVYSFSSSSSSNHSCCNTESLYGCPCRNIVPQGKFDSLKPQFFIMFCFLLSLSNSIYISKEQVGPALSILLAKVTRPN